MVDDDDALAQRLDVRHVVAREQHRGAVALVVLGDERADPLLHRHVEADRRLVEEEHPRLVQERADDLGLHPLPERELPHRLPDEVADVEQLDQLVAQRRELVARDAVDRAVELVRVECRKIPLQLVAIAHHERDPAEERTLALCWDMAEHVRVPAARMEQPGKHLQRRRLPGAVRAQEAHDLALADGERDGVDRTHLARLPLDRPFVADRSPGSRSGTSKTFSRRSTTTAWSLISRSASASRAASRTSRPARRPRGPAGSRRHR